MRIRGLVLWVAVVSVWGLVVMPFPSWAKERPLNGAQREYYSNGHVRRIWWYKEGSLVRKKVFYRHGPLFRDAIFRDGQMIVRRQYYREGPLEAVWTKASGEVRLYNQDGSLHRVISVSAKGSSGNQWVQSLVP